MTRVLKYALSLATLLLLSFVVQAGIASTPSVRVKQTQSPIATLAMDGPRVAYAVGKKVYVWNTLTGATTLMKGKYGAHTSEVAIAGTRLAWITRYVVGNSYQTTENLYTAPIGARSKLLASGRRYLSGPETTQTWYGRWIAGAVGSGKTLAVSTWWSARDGTCIGQRLNLITATGLKSIAAGPGTIMSASSDSGRIAVLRSEDAWPTYGTLAAGGAPATVGVYSTSGTLLREITPSSAEEVALTGNTLVVLTEIKTLEVYDWTTGKLVHTWPVARSTPNLKAGHLAAYGQVAVYSVDPRRSAPRKLHVIRLTTGKDVVLATGGGAGYESRDAAIGPRGLVYVVNYHQHGRLSEPMRGKLVFVPLARVLRAVS